MAGLEGGDEHGRVLDTFVDHLVSQLAHVEARLGVVDKPQPFGTDEVLGEGGDSFPMGGKVSG